MRRLASFALVLFAACVPSAQACDCGGCPPTSCGTTSTTAPGSGLLSIRLQGQHGPLRAYDLASGRSRFSLPPGLLSADGRRYVSLAVRGRQVTFRSYDARSGRRLRAWHSVGTNLFLGALSANGRTLAVVHGAPHATRIDLVDVTRSRLLRRLSFRGWFDVDAVSNDGRRLFLIQYLRGGGGYLIRRYDAVQRELASRPLTEKGAPMNGTAWDAVASPDGRRLLTLYLRGAGVPEVHTLDLVRGSAVCIDLPRGDSWSVQQYSLALSHDGRTLYAANPALGVVATVALGKLRVVRVVHFEVNPEPGPLAPNAVTSHDGRTIYFSAGTLLFAYDAAYGVVRGPYVPGTNIAGIAFSRDDRTLLVIGRDGRAIRLNAATGRARD